MKCLLFLSVLLSPFLSVFAEKNSNPINSTEENTSAILAFNANPTLEISNGNVSQNNFAKTSQNQTSMLYYIIPVAIILFVVICLVALSKRLLFEQ